MIGTKMVSAARRHLCGLAMLASLLSPGPAAMANAGPVVRVGALKFGAVAWTLDTMKRQGFDRAHGVTVEEVPMAASNAAQIALQGDTVDVIQSDWLWVARNRSEGRDYQFAPSSTALGAIYVRPDAGIATLTDLKGKRLGVAGTAVDKSWLLVQAYARETGGIDLAHQAKISFAAPPALNALLQRGKLDAVLNFWPYAARLRAAGMKPLLDMRTVLADFDATRGAPMQGWVFAESYAKAHGQALDAFLAAVEQTNAYLRSHDEAWPPLRGLMKAKSGDELTALRDAYRAGVDPDDLTLDLTVLHRLYAILAKEGGEALIGRAKALDDGTFYRADAGHR